MVATGQEAIEPEESPTGDSPNSNAHSTSLEDDAGTVQTLFTCASTLPMKTNLVGHTHAGGVSLGLHLHGHVRGLGLACRAHALKVGEGFGHLERYAPFGRGQLMSSTRTAMGETLELQTKTEG